jgi:hypothetical protein
MYFTAISASSVWPDSGAAVVAAVRLRVGLLGATWDLRQTAGNTLSYQLVVRAGWRWLAHHKTGFVDLNQPPRGFPADRRATKAWSGRIFDNDL